MFVHANEENNERQTTKLQERAKRIRRQGGMEMSWVQVALSNMHTNLSEATVSLLWGIFQSHFAPGKGLGRYDVHKQGLSGPNWTDIKQEYFARNREEEERHTYFLIYS